ncbi:MAG: multiheme c-type cytochrome [Myxococcaceae bacterium]
MRRGLEVATTSDRRPVLILFAVAMLATASACTKPEQYTLTREALLDPVSCKGCHPDTYDDWAGSMHAYAAEDPVFIAMNRRGQRETQGAMGKFCVQCHAPVAFREGLSTDGLNLAELPSAMRGVTCFACHSVDNVEGTHNNPLRIAEDGVMRGGIRDPLRNGAHASAYSALHDRDRSESSFLCGACHDVVTDHGATIERTFAEWQVSVFGKSTGGTSCGQCHMPQSAEPRPVAAVTNAPLRRSHSHRWPAVDVALTPFPSMDLQRQEVQTALDNTLQSALCVEQGGRRVHVILDNVGAGHSFPSGSAQDRRLWVEILGYSGANVVYQSGAIPLGGDITALTDPDLWLMRDCMFDAAKAPVDMFWEAVTTEGNTLRAPVTLDITDPRYYQSHVYASYPRTGALPNPVDRVTARVLLQPVGTHVLQSLIASGDLDPAVVSAMPTFVVNSNTSLEWTPAATLNYVDKTTGQPVTCVTATNLDVRADKFPAKRVDRCGP